MKSLSSALPDRLYWALLHRENDISRYNTKLTWLCRKRIPPGAPDSCESRLMGAVERALRNTGTRKTKYIFELAIGTKFNCVTEAQEFYNIYSSEAGFGTKKGDKHGDTIQEFHCRCKVIVKSILYIPYSLQPCHFFFSSWCWKGN